jgi:hypothetical protein
LGATSSAFSLLPIRIGSTVSYSAALGRFPRRKTPNENARSPTLSTQSDERKGSIHALTSHTCIETKKMCFDTTKEPPSICRIHPVENGGITIAFTGFAYLYMCLCFYLLFVGLILLYTLVHDLWEIEPRSVTLPPYVIRAGLSVSRLLSRSQ